VKNSEYFGPSPAHPKANPWGPSVCSRERELSLLCILWTGGRVNPVCDLYSRILASVLHFQVLPKKNPRRRGSKCQHTSHFHFHFLNGERPTNLCAGTDWCCHWQLCHVILLLLDATELSSRRLFVGVTMPLPFLWQQVASPVPAPPLFMFIPHWSVFRYLQHLGSQTAMIFSLYLTEAHVLQLCRTFRWLHQVNHTARLSFQLDVHNECQLDFILWLQPIRLAQAESSWSAPRV